jgi:hypothetical protein
MFSFYQNLRVVYSQPFSSSRLSGRFGAKLSLDTGIVPRKLTLKFCRNASFLAYPVSRGPPYPPLFLGFVVVVWDIFCTLYILIVCPILLDGPLSAIDIAGRGSL